jgi:hypothetical protein
LEGSSSGGDELLAVRGGHEPVAELADFDLDKLACLEMGL